MKKVKVLYLCLLLIFSLGLFLRLFRLDEMLSFHFDQGRDAQIIMKMIDLKKLSLIGPSIGIDGPLRGPFYYWLIAPFYFMANGNPAYPAYFLAILNSFGIIISFYLGRKFFNPMVGILSSLMYAFSYEIIINSRWLANPNPAPILSLLFFWCFYEFLNNKQKYLPITLFIMSLSFHFETAGALFFIPIFILLAILLKPRFDKKIISFSLLAFILPFLPLLFFDLRHNFIISKSYFHYFLSDQANLSLLTIMINHLSISLNTFSQLLFPNLFLNIFLLILLIAFCLLIRVEKWNKGLIFLKVAIAVPFLGFLISKGNNGNLWSYYYLNYFPIIILFFAVLIFILFNSNSAIRKISAVCLLGFFLFFNIKTTLSHLLIDVNDPKEEEVFIFNQKKALHWIIRDSKGLSYNADYYVPPVIPYSYEYLFDFYNRSEKLNTPVEKLNDSLYTLYEPDPDHPERLDAWLKRQNTIGKILYEEKIGNITVQKRLRII